MDPNVEHYYFAQASRTLSRINNGDISPDQFVHEITHATSYLSHFGQQQIFYRILDCNNTQIYYALRKLEFKNLRNLINFLTEGFLYSNTFGDFAEKLENSSRDHDEYFYYFFLRLQNILQKAEYQLKKLQPQLSDIFIQQLDALARMVFVRELPSTLYHEVYRSAPETLYDASELANHFYYTNCTSYRHLCGEYRSIPPTNIKKKIQNYCPAPRLENSSTESNQYDYNESCSSTEDERNFYFDRASRNSSTESDKSYNSPSYPATLKIGPHIFPVKYRRTVSNNYIERLVSVQDSTFSESVLKSEGLPECPLYTECSGGSRTDSETSLSALEDLKIEEFPEFPESLDSFDDLQTKPEYSTDSDYTEPEGDNFSISDHNNEIQRPVSSYCSMRILSPTKGDPEATNKTKLKQIDTCKTETFKINSKSDKSPVPDFREVSEYQLTPTKRETLSARPNHFHNCEVNSDRSKPKSYKKLPYFRFTPILKKGYKISPKINKFLSLYRHNSNTFKTSSKSTCPHLTTERFMKETERWIVQKRNFKNLDTNILIKRTLFKIKRHQFLFKTVKINLQFKTILQLYGAEFFNKFRDVSTIKSGVIKKDCIQDILPVIQKSSHIPLTNYSLNNTRKRIDYIKEEKLTENLFNSHTNKLPQPLKLPNFQIQIVILQKLIYNISVFLFCWKTASELRIANARNRALDNSRNKYQVNFSFMQNISKLNRQFEKIYKLENKVLNELQHTRRIYDTIAQEWFSTNINNFLYVTNQLETNNTLTTDISTKTITVSVQVNIKSYTYIFFNLLVNLHSILITFLEISIYFIL